MSGGGIGTEFIVFLVGVFTGGYTFGAEVVGEVFFCWQKLNWYVR